MKEKFKMAKAVSFTRKDGSRGFALVDAKTKIQKITVEGSKQPKEVVVNKNGDYALVVDVIVKEFTKKDGTTGTSIQPVTAAPYATAEFLRNVSAFLALFTNNTTPKK